MQLSRCKVFLRRIVALFANSGELRANFAHSRMHPAHGVCVYACVYVCVCVCVCVYVCVCACVSGDVGGPTRLKKRGEKRNYMKREDTKEKTHEKIRQMLRTSHVSLLQNMVSFIGLFCQRDL